ncbi:MAG: sigma-54-dependent Fis family transcriptional regulator [bacterium]|nr:sigma-54-dependent Fis family transcriptional regulator [bacterium]
MKSHEILIVDDDKAVVTSLALLLKQAGYGTHSAADPEAALTLLDKVSVDLVLQDMNFSRQTTGEEGLDLLRRIKGRNPHLPVVLITAWGSVELAVKGVKAGATDFITKPWTHGQILHSVRSSLGAAEIRQADTGQEPVSRLDLDSAHDFSGLIGMDPAFLHAMQVVGRVAATDASVLITGESGTGKELFAEALWRNSTRADEPFVKVNLGGIQPTLFESEMFGHVKGAFTDAKEARRGRFEAAQYGTLFLDEVGDIDAGCQVKLLRVLQDRTFERVGSSTTVSVDVRVISATNRDLAAMIEAGQFREDLLYRLNLIAVHVPPLRQRRGDIPLLAAYFLQGLSVVYRRPELRLNASAVEWLANHAWPGNVRELKHVIERTVLLSSDDVLKVEHFTAASEAPGMSEEAGEQLASGLTLDEMERTMILRAIEQCGGNLTKAAQSLGLSRGAFYRRLDKHRIRP